MRHLPLLLLAAIALTLLGACGPVERDYSSWASIPADGWAYGDTVSLMALDTAIPDNDSVLTAALTLALRHTSAYPYSNIWLELTYTGTDGLDRRDSIDLPLADPYGRWIGSGFGASYQRTILVNPRAAIDLRRPLLVRHIMRIDTLPAIDQIGIEIARP